ncbi:MAG: translation initiation factor IF-5A [Candidatus Thermoplasmatota archaeon]|nr:translation initiation factor IF-5A [Candidatus Thermoplasmatota archaeon]
MKTMAEVRTLKVGRYIIVDDEPCKILGISTSKPGKHGESKARIDAMGLFDKQKRSIVHPVKHKVGVPMIDKRTAQVLSIAGSTVQLMDMATYETFELPLPDDMTLEPGKEIQYMEALGRKKITRA